MNLISSVYDFLIGIPLNLSENIKKTFYKTCIVIFIFVIVLWFSASLYALIYYLYIPAVAHVKPVYLKYDVRCMEKGKCVFPYDNITLVQNDEYELLSRGQIYAIELILDMPETYRNLDQGMFMVRLDMQSENGAVLRSSRRPAILRYKSPLLKVASMLLFAPSFLLGSSEEKQSLSIPLFEAYQESYHQSTHYAFVEIQAAFADIYSCSLRIHAQFTGLRYLMYYWPITSAVTSIAMISSTITMMFIVIWLQQIMNAENYVNLRSSPEKEDSLVQEIRQSMKEKAAKEAMKKKGVSTKSTGLKRSALKSSSPGERIEELPHRDTSDGSEEADDMGDLSLSEEIENISFQRDSEDEYSLGEEEDESHFSKLEEPSSEIENILQPSESSTRRRR